MATSSTQDTSAAPTIVLPGQPLYVPSGTAPSAAVNAGKGTFKRDSQILSSAVGKLVRDGGSLTVIGKEQNAVVPEAGSTVLGIVARLSRVQAVVNIVAVDGIPCQQDWQGIIRIADIRQTDKDKIKIWDCFRPGDIVRASVISLGDVRSYYLSTARNDLGVIFARHAETGNKMQAISWQEMQDLTTGAKEPRKVAGPSP